MTPIGDDLIVRIKEIFAWLLPSSLGVATKLAYDSRVKKLTRKEVITSLIFACFIAYIVDTICTKLGYVEWRGVLVAISALASESAVGWILKNVGTGLTAWLKRAFNVDLKNNDNGNTNTDTENRP